MIDDPCLFSPGSRLRIHLVRLPAVAEWRAAAELLGVSFELDTEEPLGAGPLVITARDEVSRVTLTFQISESTSEYPADEADSAEELAVYRRTRWAVHIQLPSEMPDLLPTALAVALTAAGEGICYHANLDRAVLGSDAHAMLDELRWYAEDIDRPR